MKSTERLATAFIAITGHRDSSAMVSLTVIGQFESSGVGTTAQRGAEADIAASRSSAAEAATPGGTGGG